MTSYNNIVGIPNGGITANMVSLEFNTISGNMPNTYNNTLFLWQNADIIPFDTEPLKKQAIDVNTKDGSVVFEDLDLQRKSYIIAYSLSERAKDICSYVQIPAKADESQIFHVYISHINLLNIGTDSLVVSYFLPDGDTPVTNNFYLCLYENGVPDHSGARILKKVLVNNNRSMSSQGMNNIKLLRGMTYGVGLIANDDPSKIIAFQSFVA